MLRRDGKNAYLKQAGVPILFVVARCQPLPSTGHRASVSCPAGRALRNKACHPLPAATVR
ncbi:hypothetical protein CBM2598_U20112 [Cupriavidus taiwanensis]|nr:hypothetical protein CBM2598_U20112 [Cupriavidus taiwanensis]